MDNTTENAAGEALKTEDLLSEISRTSKEAQEKLVKALLEFDALYKDLLQNQNHLADRNESLTQEAQKLEACLKEANGKLSDLEDANTGLQSELSEANKSRDEWKEAFHRIQKSLGEMLKERTESLDVIDIAAKRISLKESPFEIASD